MSTTNESVVEVVKFTASGLTEIDARTKAFGKGVTEAVTQQKALAGVLADPAYAKYEERIAAISRRTELMALQARNVALAARVADGSYATQLRSVTQLNGQFERMQRLAQIKPRYAHLAEIRGVRQRQQKLEAGMSDGSLAVLARRQREYDRTERAAERAQRLAAPKSGRAFQEETRGVRQQQQKLEAGMSDGSLAVLERRRREYEKTRREAELIMQYGERTGRFLSKYGTALGVAGKVGTYAATAALATGGGLVHKGFGGTVEANRLELETKMLGRELAGAFKPVIDVVTKGARSLRKFMETLGPAGQNVVMFGGLALSGAMALRMLGGGHLLGMAAKLALGGGAAAVAGGAATAAASTAAVAAATATAVNSANAKAAAKTGGRGSNIAKAGLIAGALMLGERMIDAPSERPEELKGTAGMRRYYDRQRRDGDSMLEAGGSVVGRGLAKMVGLTSGPKTEAEEREDAANAHGRRQVSLAGGGFEEGGSGFDRIANAIASVDSERAASDEEGESLVGKALLEAVRKLNENLDRGTSPPLTRPGG